MFLSCVFCKFPILGIMISLYIIITVLTAIYYISTDKVYKSPLEILLWPWTLLINIKNFIKKHISSYKKRNELNKKSKRDVVNSILKEISDEYR